MIPRHLGAHLGASGDAMLAVEAKSGRTPVASWLDAPAALAEVWPATQRPLRRVVVYGGDERQARSDGEIVPLRELDELVVTR